MIREPPREHEWLSWLWAAFLAAVILVTIPFARAITDFVAARWGRAVFRDIVTMLVILALGILILIAFRLRDLPRRNVLWLLLAGALMLYFTLGVRASAEETIHFLEYCALGFLVFRALAHRTRDLGIYPAAFLICATLGLFDEVVQWFTPERVFDLRDVGFNAVGGAISQMAIAGGFSPRYIRPSVQPATVRRLCLYAAAFVGLFWLCLSNTPAMTARLVCRIPQLWYLLYKTSAMTEFGYKHKIPEMGTFFSRFTLEELRDMDRRRAEEVAAILNSYHDPRRYGKFLRTYTPLTDPFTHEARVHLFRRDHYLSVAPKYDNNPKMSLYHYTVAWREHLFVKTYFPETLSRSFYRWHDHVEIAVESKTDFAMEYVSDVSANLITSFSLQTVHGTGIVIFVGLFGIWAWTWKWERAKEQKEPA